MSSQAISQRTSGQCSFAILQICVKFHEKSGTRKSSAVSLLNADTITQKLNSPQELFGFCFVKKQ
ncbi:CLUMA_CG014821, isoform A [Clunio marinus]|uniref:CLUMA_CG014821, isoform A n=1 Tax=Clunio marinus TaxID=568069 RepID=A0A1J1IS06_9DIPT|nr:CLUMA_CG014821, isoform A [Clunio marinus]